MLEGRRGTYQFNAVGNAELEPLQSSLSFFFVRCHAKAMRVN